MKTLVSKINSAKCKLYCTYAMVMTAVICPMSVDAAGLTEKAKSALETVQNFIVSIGLPLYGVIAAYCIIMILASSGQKADRAKSWLITATIAVVALGSLSVIIDFVAGIK